MTFSLISVAVLLIAALIIIIEVVRAVKRGMRKTLITLASLFLAVFSSIIISYFVSDFFAIFAYNFKSREIELSGLSEKIPNIKEIFIAYADAIIAPIIFIMVFFIMRGLIAIVMAIVNKAMAKKIDSYKYESEDAPYYRKKPNLTNALLGGLCGFMVVVICISPIMGTLKMVNKAFNDINANSANLGMKIKGSVTQYTNKYSNDLVGNVFYYCGGNLVYKSTATSTLNDNYFGFEREVDGTLSTMGDIMKVSSTLSNIGNASEGDKAKLKNLGANINKAETLKRIAADIVPKLAENWSKNEPYEGVEKPKVSKAASTFFNQMLHVCKKSTPDTVGEDLSTLLNVYLIAYENDILMSENYKDMLEKSKRTGALDLIKKELEKNPRMAAISLEIDNMTMTSLATAIQNFNIGSYDVLMGEMSVVLNTAMNLEGEERLNYIRRYAKGYIRDYGIDIGDDVVNEVTERLVDEVINTNNGNITKEDVMAFIDKYSVKKNNNNNSQIDEDTFFGDEPVGDETVGDEIETDKIPDEDDTNEDVWYPEGDESDFVDDGNGSYEDWFPTNPDTGDETEGESKPWWEQ